MTLRQQLHVDYKKIRELNSAPKLGEIINSIYVELDDISQTSLLKMIDNRPPQLTDSVFNAIDGYSIFRVVAITEQFFRNLIKNLIDNEPDLVNLVIKDISNKPNDVTIGEAVSTTFQYQNPNDINKVMSKLLKIDFFGNMKKHLEIKPDSNAGNVFARDYLLNNWNDLHMIFSVRHQLAHTMNSSLSLKGGFLRGLLYSVEVFLYISLAMTASSERIRQRKLDSTQYQNQFDTELESILKPNL